MIPLAQASRREVPAGNKRPCSFFSDRDSDPNAYFQRNSMGPALQI